ncbi:hypothetical protein MKW98_016987 [Papaver atlanticum]|uniref:Uncharacterized protein n=1 Tax=Papaver atlanticum TaxID=357466 RepID=A0AAD4XZ03_9MAGN|nr:hypothetical protein MKW98_016987 [Papaver atlanticum]
MLHTQEYSARRAVANGVQITLSKTSMLANCFIGLDGKYHYGYVTPGGLALFRPSLGVETPKDERYRLCFSNFIHTLISTTVFAVIIGGDRRVTHCLLRKHVKEIDDVMESFPLIVGVICSWLYLVFPNTRYGVGCIVT